jgi:hypothetical protein
MGKLQERTKPLLLPFLDGEITVIDVNQQQILAAWIAMFVMVAEHFDPYKVVTPLLERQLLMNEKRAPPNWNIWFGDLDQNSKWPSLLNHFAVPISTPEHIPETMDNGLPRPNTQTMTFRVGRLYVHVRSSMTDIFENWRFVRPDLLGQIWPVRRNLIVWPPRTTLSDRDADAIAADQNGKTPDAVVVKAIARASIWFEQLTTGKSQSMAEIAVREHITDNYVSNLIHLAWLSPDLVGGVLEGDSEAAALARAAMLSRKSDALWGQG